MVLTEPLLPESSLSQEARAGGTPTCEDGFLSSMRKASQEINILNFDLEDLILPHKSIVVKLPVPDQHLYKLWLGPYVRTPSNFKEPTLSKGIYSSRVVESIIVYLLMLSFFLENGHSECACPLIRQHNFD